jgi:anti-sigma regulatory factor (Ser/Thr protein kinase)
VWERAKVIITVGNNILMLIEVSEASQAGEARRGAVALVEELGMSETRRGAVAIVATEMATNLVKHAGRGHILVQRLARPHRPGLRVISADKGPGVADVSLALLDGHSTAGSMGSGLGAIQRLSDSFDFYSVPGSGTVVIADFWQDQAETGSAGLGWNENTLQIGVVSEPIRGEEVCGDGWAVRLSSDKVILMVVDGLGHGVLAAEPAREAERVLAAARSEALTEILQEAHLALKKTRGAALALAKIEPGKNLLTFTGVGNISASILDSSSSRSMAPHNGILGRHMDRIQEFTAPWNPGNLLVMHSDGLISRWDLKPYPGIWNRHPSLVAALLHRDFSRGRDDATVLAAKTK